MVLQIRKYLEKRNFNLIKAEKFELIFDDLNKDGKASKKVNKEQIENLKENLVAFIESDFLMKVIIFFGLNQFIAVLIVIITTEINLLPEKLIKISGHQEVAEKL